MSWVKVSIFFASILKFCRCGVFSICQIPVDNVQLSQRYSTKPSDPKSLKLAPLENLSFPPYQKCDKSSHTATDLTNGPKFFANQAFGNMFELICSRIPKISRELVFFQDFFVGLCLGELVCASVYYRREFCLDIKRIDPVMVKV